ncbi:MAG: hypothetical protein FJ038_10345 [Chloroflexi bacterium]|nr:hypothetical protein [Chloroflexota bacterium]
MDILSHENLLDLLVILLLVAAFVVGFLQGAVRRLIGIAAATFSLILAAQLRAPLGDYLASNWLQFPPTYPHMLAFGAVFVISVIVIAIITQLYYERGPLLPKTPLADPLLGGLLGMVEAMVLIGGLVLVLDSYFLPSSVIAGAGEFVVIRDLASAVDVSRTAALFRDDLFPAFFFVIGLLIPEELRSLYLR